MKRHLLLAASLAALLCGTTAKAQDAGYFAQITYTSTGGSTYAIPFPYLSTSDIQVYVNGTLQSSSTYSFPTTATLTFSSAPTSGATVVIKRKTSVASADAVFSGGAVASASLNLNQTQTIYGLQESRDAILALGSGGGGGSYLPLTGGTLTGSLTAAAGVTMPAGTVINWNGDVGLSRDAAGSIAIGNGTQGNLTGSMDVGKLIISANANLTSTGAGLLQLGTGGTSGAGGSLSLTNLTSSGTITFPHYSVLMNDPDGTFLYETQAYTTPTTAVNQYQNNLSLGNKALNPATHYDPTNCFGTSSTVNFCGDEVAVGAFALGADKYGNDNTAIGDHALANLYGGKFNTAVGSSAGANLNNAQYVDAYGVSACQNVVNPAGPITCLGSGTLQNAGNTSQYMAAVGNQAGSTATVATFSVLAGASAAFSATSINYSAAIGDASCSGVSSLTGSICIGFNNGPASGGLTNVLWVGGNYGAGNIPILYGNLSSNYLGIGTTSLVSGAALTVNGSAALTSITGSTQCLQANTNGLISGTGAACGGSGVTAGNPSASIGLTAVNGSATTYLRSDGAPALSQAISPTWSGTHTFSNAPILSSLTGYLYGNGAGAITASTTVPAASVSGLSGTYAPLASPNFTGTPTVPGYLTTAAASSTYAPLASPALTGTPTAPTASAGTSTTQLATTAFTAAAVSARGLQSSGQQQITTSTTLSSAQAGANILVSGSGITLTFPATVATYALSNIGSSPVTLAYTGSGPGSDLGTTLAVGEQVILAGDGNGYWRMVSLSGPVLGTPTSLTLTNATGLPLSGLVSQAANTVVANVTNASAVPTAASMPTCSSANQALQYSPGTGFVCNTGPVAGAMTVNSEKVFIGSSPASCAVTGVSVCTLTKNAGTAAFKYTLTTGTPTGSTVTLALPGATSGYVCDGVDLTTPGRLVETTDSVTSPVLTNYNLTTSLAQTFSAGAVLIIKCSGY